MRFWLVLVFVGWAVSASAQECTTVKPGPINGQEWSCVNGGWIPPGITTLAISVPPKPMTPSIEWIPGPIIIDYATIDCEERYDLISSTSFGSCETTDEQVRVDLLEQVIVTWPMGGGKSCSVQKYLQSVVTTPCTTGPKATIADLQAKLDSANAQITTLTNQVSSLAGQLTISQQTVADISKQLDDIVNPKTCQGGFIALTFDDGPDPIETPKKLDALKAAGIKATFFVMGVYVRDYPDIARRIVAEGHEIANHSWDHPSLREGYYDDITGLPSGRLTNAQIDKQIKDTQDIIEATTGVRPRYFRAPYGETDAAIEARVDAGGLVDVLWSHDTADWYTPTNTAAIYELLRTTQPGDIVLMHDHVPGSTLALPSLFQHWKAYPNNPVCAGKIGPTKEVYPVDDWQKFYMFFKAVIW